MGILAGSRSDGRTWRAAFLLICAFAGLTLIVNAQIAYYVRQDGIGTCISWDDDSGDLQAMINKASEGDSIWKENVCTLSGDIGTEDDDSDNLYHVVIFIGADKSTVLDGFTIANGTAREVTPYHTITVGGEELSTSSGGSMYAISSSPTISNIIFTLNYVQSFTDGGGSEKCVCQSEGCAW